MPAIESAFLGGPSGWTGDWHVSSGRNLFVVISGEGEIEASDGTVRRFSSPDVLLAEDTSGKGHRLCVVSQEDSPWWSNSRNEVSSHAVVWASS